MKIFQKPKVVVRHILLDIINIFPVCKRIIIFESIDFGDNSKALFDRMKERGITEKYRILWVVRNVEEHQQIYLGVKFIPYDTLTTLVGRLYRIFAGYCFSSFKPVGISGRKGQVRCFLTHGLSFKDTRQFYLQMDVYTDIITTSEFSAELRKKTFQGTDQSLMHIFGYPRTDQFFRHSDVKRQMKISENLRLIVWMPTFKHNVEGQRNDGGESGNDLLSLLNEEELEYLNKRLLEKNVFLMIKYHPNQDLKFVKMIAHSNLKTYINHDLSEKRIGIYEILAESDGLITDFSSVYTDYLLCDRPIGFDISGMENYRLGFSVDNPIDYMPGIKIEGIKDLLSFVDIVTSGTDPFSEKRLQLKKQMHQYMDGKSADRIIDYFGL